MRRWTNEDGINMCEPNCVDEWLWHIWAIGVDYDGCRTEESLMELVDELVDMANKARECLWENRLFGDFGSPSDKDPKTSLCKLRCEDKCNEYCDGWNTYEECYVPSE